MQSCKLRLSRCPSLVRWVCSAFCGAMWLCLYALQTEALGCPGEIGCGSIPHAQA